MSYRPKYFLITWVTGETTPTFVHYETKALAKAGYNASVAAGYATSLYLDRPATKEFKIPTTTEQR